MGVGPGKWGYGTLRLDVVSVGVAGGVGGLGGLTWRDFRVSYHLLLWVVNFDNVLNLCE